MSYPVVGKLASDKALCIVALIVAVGSGCNSSRYGLNHDQRLGRISRVVLLPMDVKVSSFHTGGRLEHRPDLSDEAQHRLLSEVSDLVTERGCTPVVTTQPEPANPHTDPPPQSAPLAAAVRQAIQTHHYVHGNGRVFDHSIGRSVRELLDESDGGDAVLVVQLHGAVPTGGRVGLTVTAVIIGGLFGIHTLVKQLFIGVGYPSRRRKGRRRP